MKINFQSIVHEKIEINTNEYKYTVIIYVDSSECTPCSFRHLMLWKMHLKDLQNNNIGILLITHHSNQQIVDSILQSNKITFPCVIDPKGQFKVNSFSKYCQSIASASNTNS